MLDLVISLCIFVVSKFSVMFIKKIDKSSKKQARVILPTACVNRIALMIWFYEDSRTFGGEWLSRQMLDDCRQSEFLLQNIDDE